MTGSPNTVTTKNSPMAVVRRENQKGSPMSASSQAINTIEMVGNKDAVQSRLQKRIPTTEKMVDMTPKIKSRTPSGLNKLLMAQPKIKA